MIDPSTGWDRRRELGDRGSDKGIVCARRDELVQDTWSTAVQNGDTFEDTQSATPATGTPTLSTKSKLTSASRRRLSKHCRCSGLSRILPTARTADLADLDVQTRSRWCPLRLLWTFVCRPAHECCLGRYSRTSSPRSARSLVVSPSCWRDSILRAMIAQQLGAAAEFGTQWTTRFEVVTDFWNA